MDVARVVSTGFPPGAQLAAGLPHGAAERSVSESGADAQPGANTSERLQPDALRLPGDAEAGSAAVAEDWHSELQRALRTVGWLVERLRLPQHAVPRSDYGFPVVVTDSFLRRMRPADPRDPLLLQVLPRDEEGRKVAGYVADPLREQDQRPVPGVIHKYRGRVLFVLTGLCAVHCRYCFRRAYPYQQEPRSLAQWQPAIDYVAARRDIREVILSGGDPLVWSDGRLGELLQRLAEVPHLARVRVHSRLPIVLPARVTANLLSTLTATRLRPWLVVHANHPQELRGDCAAALDRLRDAGIPLLNQAVLLREINDSVATLAALAERLGDLGIGFYYLHQLDPVQGAAHFAVSDRRAAELLAALRERVSGYLVPRLVREQPGAPSKTTLAW